MVLPSAWTNELTSPSAHLFGSQTEGERFPFLSRSQEGEETKAPAADRCRWLSNSFISVLSRYARGRDEDYQKGKQMIR